MNSLIYKVITIFFLLMFTTLSSASEEPADNTKQETVLSTINQLYDLGYITADNAKKAKLELLAEPNTASADEIVINEETIDEKTIDEEATIEEGYFTAINILKSLAVIALLIVFHKVIFEIVRLIVAIPAIILQSSLLFLGYMLISQAESIWALQAYYVSIIGVVIHIGTFYWFIFSYEDALEAIARKLTFNRISDIDIIFYAGVACYTAYFTIDLQSPVLGILAVSTFILIFGENFCRLIGVEEENKNNVLLISTGLIVVSYSVLKVMQVNIPWLSYFSIGIEYAATGVLAFGLFVYSRFNIKIIDNDNKVRQRCAVVAFVIIEILSLIALLTFNLPVIPAIINTVFFLYAIMTVVDLVAYKHGMLAIVLVAIILYGVAVLIESFPELFIQNLF
jgi:hypothetical protein